jgi:hypothetical protein
VITAALTTIHLIVGVCAAAWFWFVVAARKGSRPHRRAGRHLVSILYVVVATGVVCTLVDQFTADLRPTGWLTAYLLVGLGAAAQHGVAAVAAAADPKRVRSPWHLTLNSVAVLGAFAVFPAVLIWHRWEFLPLIPAVFTVGLRDMLYANRAAAAAREWQLEHLTSTMAAGIALHTVLLVRVAQARPAWFGGSSWTWAVWLAPLAVGAALVLGTRVLWSEARAEAATRLA